MVKSYLKFEHSKTFGQICSASSNVLYEPSSTTFGSASTGGGGHAIVGANEDVLVWDIKKGELLNRWTVSDNTAQATVISRCQAAPELFAVGYDDGKIRLWDSITATVVITFNGHKSAITCLVFDGSGTRLASGSRDTDIIIWDLVAELGLCRLRGHKDQITSINFLSTASGPTAEDSSRAQVDSDSDKYLLSTSKDALIKVWDLSSQHCIETHVAQSNGECWALGLSPDSSGCITAGNEGELKVWSIDSSAIEQVASGKVSKDERILQERGTFYRQGRDRTMSVKFHPKRDIIAIHGSEKSIELWRIRSEDEVRKALLRKRKRRKEKAALKSTGSDITDSVMQEDDGLQDDQPIDISAAPATEIFVPLVIVRTGGKVRSLDWAGGKSGKSVSILVSTTNNQLEVFDVSITETKKSKDIPDYNRTFSLDTPGHRSDIRALALSSDDRMLASASHGSLKIWNVRTTSCLRTIECGYALCAAFLPGDKIVVLGTREGTLEVYDIASSTLLDTIQAHERDIWGLHVQPDGKGLVTGSADKSAKFWSFKVVQEEVLGTTRKQSKLTLVHTRTLKVSDDILAIRFSPDTRLVALSTLDNTIKVFFVDSLKLYLTLYGHKLPVLSLDISSDSKLLVSSSADKNVRIWGLDFGDCHKAFFAHQDSILSVSFVPPPSNNTYSDSFSNGNEKGHHFFSASKDKTIKYFDGDKFETIQTLKGHQGEIWAMAVSRTGSFIVSASHDKSIRIWNETDEQIFLEEEREKELEELFEGQLLSSLEADERNTTLNDGNESQTEVVGEATRQTAQTLMAGEKIAEALELGIEDLEIMKEYQTQKQQNPKTALPQRNPVFLANNNVSAQVYVLNVFQRIPAASLQDALLVLSFSQLPTLLTFLAIWAREGRNIPLTCRVLFFMLKVHQKQIVGSGLMRGLLEEVRTELRTTLQKMKGELGFNLAGLRVLGRRIGEARSERAFVDGVVDDEEEGVEDDVETKGKGKGRSEKAGGGGGAKKRTFVNVA